jgi:hypothetical protein
MLEFRESADRYSLAIHRVGSPRFEPIGYLRIEPHGGPRVEMTEGRVLGVDELRHCFEKLTELRPRCLEKKRQKPLRIPLPFEQAVEGLVRVDRSSLTPASPEGEA